MSMAAAHAGPRPAPGAVLRIAIATLLLPALGDLGGALL
jgi:hypothetical protein